MRFAGTRDAAPTLAAIEASPYAARRSLGIGSFRRLRANGHFAGCLARLAERADAASWSTTSRLYHRAIASRA